ncbi:hypothetical protein AX16_005848 [Volvariella volvacea WC 439]|nr:hypothetical protein AX16_005848 [Volvariella volvacea WC 439]
MSSFGGRHPTEQVTASRGGSATSSRPIDSRVIDPALLRLEQHPSAGDSDKKDISTPVPGQPASQSPMPHRVEPYPMSSSYVHPPHYHLPPFEPAPSHHPSRFYDDPHRRVSPPPIAAITHSPSPSLASLDRSSASTPTSRRTPPHSYHSPPAYPAPYAPSARYSADALPRPYPAYQHQYDPPQQAHRYAPVDLGQEHSPYHQSSAVPHLAVASMPPAPQRDSYGSSYPLPGQNHSQLILTDDAATKLNDRVRRRCFNCCTTDTSTWRRSNLSPGKVLCNKCGLFERTHSRPRPDQFPHKRGPLASTTLRSRTPPVTHLPPISPPNHYNHPSIAPLHGIPDTRRDHHQPPAAANPPPVLPPGPNNNTLPALESWHAPGSHGVPPAQPVRRPTMEPNPHGRPVSPASRSPPQQQPPPSSQPTPPQQHHTLHDSRDAPAVHDPAQ